MVKKISTLAKSLGFGIAVATLCTANVSAESYAVVNVGYGNVDTEFDGESDVSYSAALGYQFHRQWYVEGGYISLIDADNDDQSLSSSGPYLAFLGKASSTDGELYYKLGIASIDIEQTFTSTDVCGESSEFCGYDESVIAGMAGLGFDYHLGYQSMLRVEYTYFGGKDDFSAHIVNLGFRYNF